MTSRNLFAGAFASALSFACALLGGGVANASTFTVVMGEVGPNVVANGSGTIDLTGLVGTFNGTSFGQINPNFGLIVVGPSFASGSAPDTEYPVAFSSGPTLFGSGGFSSADAGGGNVAGVIVHDLAHGTIIVPFGYVSGAPLLDNAIWANQTLASLGVTLGTYTWRWGATL